MSTNLRFLKSQFLADLLDRTKSDGQSEAVELEADRQLLDNRSESHGSFHAFPGGLLIHFNGSGSADLGIGSGI